MAKIKPKIEMKHYDYLKTISRIVEGGWGQKAIDEETAARALLDKPEKALLFAVLELIGRFNKFIEIMAGGGPREPKELERDATDIKLFPDAKVGDVLYRAEIVDEKLCVSTYTILVVEEDGAVLTVEQDYPYNGDTVRVHYADDVMFDTLQECVSELAKWEVEYNEGQVKAAKKCLEILEHGGDLKEMM